ncbi:MAG: helix-turn-helix transcriptional regulator [Lachnospiraceae bacterium]|nr:helix-turn-helix transcriptional regulator [Lachnospiraceae bacterium]
MQLYVELMDEIVKDLQDTCINIFSTAECRLYSYRSVDNSVWESTLQGKIVKMLQSQTKQKYYDVFVYYYRDDRIFSGKNTSLKIDEYYDAYYSNFWEIDCKDAFVDMLKSEHKKPTCHVINNGSEKPYLCMTMGAKDFINSGLSYTICVVLDPEYVNSLILMDAKEDSTFLVYNKNKELLLTNNKHLEEISSTEFSNWEKQERDVWIENGNYLVKISESQFADNIYVDVISSSMFWNTLKQLRYYCYVGVALCIVISGAFSYWSAVRVYRPVSKVMHFLSTKNKNATSERNKEEFSHIMSFLEKQEENLKKEKKNNQEWFLNGLLEGKYKHANPALCEENNILFEASQFMVCIVYTEISNAEIEDMCDFVTQNILKELCSSKGNAWFVNLSKDKYAMLINTNCVEEDVYTVLEKGQRFCREELQIVLTLGCSARHEGIDGITFAYKEAQEAMRYRFLMEKEKMILYNKIQYRYSYFPNNEKSKVFMLLLEYVESKKKSDSIDDFVEQLISIYQINEEISVDAALALKNEIIGALGRIMALFGYEETSCLSAMKKLRESVTLSDFKQNLSAQIMDLCNRKISRRDNEDILAEAKEYIENNYRDNKLSVTMLGNEMGMQSAYLSKLFKERYGISILDYIALVRVNNAKKSIREKGGTIQEIAERTGFLSSHVFIRTFKKVEGITPGRYKDMVEEGQITD